MGNKINDTTNYPAVTPAATDRVLGIDVSNTTNDANGEVVTFTINSIPLSLLNNDAGFLTSVTTADVTAAGALMDGEVTNLAQVKAFDTTDYATAAQGSTADSALQDVVSDTTPQLGGSLDVNGNKIVSTSNGNIDIEPNGTGNVLLGNFTFDANQTVGAGQDDMVLTYDNAAGTIGLEAAAGGGGGGLVPISKTTASNDSAVDIDLTGGYSAYLIQFSSRSSSGTRIMHMRTSSDGGTTFDTGASDYGWVYHRLSPTSATSSAGTDDRIDLGSAMVADGANDIANFEVWVFPRTDSRYTSILFGMAASESGTTCYWANGSGVRHGTSEVDAVRFFQSLGNIYGDFHLFGRVDGDA